MFDIKEGILVETLIDDIVQIQKGNLTVIEANNLNKRCWSGDAIFDLDTVASSLLPPIANA